MSSESERDHGAFEARLDNLEAMMTEVRNDVKSLLSFRAMLLGVSAAVSAVVSLLGTFFFSK